MRNKRIFTKYLQATGCALPITGGPVDFLHFPANQFWLVQEDIEVVGVELTGGIGSAWVEMVKGSGEFHVDISQVGLLGQDGVIANIRGVWTAGQIPNVAGVWGDTKVVVMFPPDGAVPVKEEGYVYMNLYVNCYNGDAGKFLSAQAYAIIYYIKRGT
jgi:hypothetical protein